MTLEHSDKALRETLASEIRRAKISPPRSIVDFVLQDIVITDGRHKGQRYAFDRQPVVRLWFEAIASGVFNEYVCTAPSQFGKTLCAFVVPLLYHTCEIQENYVLGVPYADMAANKFEIDIAPTMRSAPRMRNLLPRHGSGSGGGRVRDTITLANGNVIKLASAGSGDGGKAGFTARVIGITEAGQFSEIGESSEEADPLRQLRARQRAYPESERCTYIEGTLTRSDQLPFRLRSLSSQSQIVSKCDGCEKWVSPEREHLSGWESAKTENEAAAKAFFVCPSCGEEINEIKRGSMLQKAVLLHAGQAIDAKGNITGDMVDTQRLWFRASAWHNLFLSAGDVARDEWKASKISEDSPERISAERELCQFVWCIPWDPPKMDSELELDKKLIGKRRLSTPRSIVPRGCVSLTTGVDLGSKAGWYLTLAKLDSGTYHVVDYDRFDIHSDQMSIEDAIIKALVELRHQLDAGYSVDGGGRRSPDEVWYDAGYKPKAVTAFVRSLSGTRKNACDIAAYGRGTNMVMRGTFALPKRKSQSVRQIDPARLWFMERDIEHRVQKLFWDADETKYQVMQALTLGQGKPGSITLYAGIDSVHERLQRHLTNEPLVTITTALGTTTRFKRQGENHLLDAISNAWRASSRYLWRSSIQEAKYAELSPSSGDSWYPDDESEPTPTPPPTPTSKKKDWYADQDD